MISKVWGFLFKPHIMTSKYSKSMSMASDFLEVLKLVRLRFRLSFFPGSHHVPWQLNCTTCAWTHLRQWSWVIQATKTQNMDILAQTCPSTQSNQSKVTSIFLHNVSLRFVSNSSFWMPSRTLLAIITERQMKILNNLKRLTTCKQVWQASAFTRHNASFAMISESSVPRQFKSKLFH